MATLMSSNDGEGHIQKCDASCYDAKGDVCTCVCGGMNHGKGLKQAMVNTNELAQKNVLDAQIKSVRAMQTSMMEILGVKP